MSARTFNPDGDRRPVVILQTFPEREAEYGEALSRSIGGDQPVVTIDASLGDTTVDLGRTEGWVEHHLGTLLELPLTPPYALCGWSYGGIVALEVADRLAAKGHDVEFVGMIDTWRPRRYPRTWPEKLLVLAAETERRPPELRRAYVASEVREALLQRRTNLLRRIGRAPAPKTASQIKPEFREGMIRNIRMAWLRYGVHHVRFPVDLFTTAESVRRCADDPSLGWSEWFLGGFNLHRVPGDHSSLWTEPHVGSLAASIRGALDIARLARVP